VDDRIVGVESEDGVDICRGLSSHNLRAALAKMAGLGSEVGIGPSACRESYGQPCQWHHCG
jgi:hypothetical protein